MPAETIATNPSADDIRAKQRARGADVPGRLVASAKSWLCHATVDRSAAILPWGAEEGARRVMTLPALRVRLDELVASIAAVTGGSAAGIRFEPDPVLEEQFGRLPALSTPLAESLGFKGDADLPALVRAALERESLAA